MRSIKSKSKNRIMIQQIIPRNRILVTGKRLIAFGMKNMRFLSRYGFKLCKVYRIVLVNTVI